MAWSKDSMAAYRCPEDPGFNSREDMEQILQRYVALYSRQLPQSSLKSSTLMQAVKEGYHPHLFRKRSCDRPGCDTTNQRMRCAGEVEKVHRAKNRNESRVRARVEHVLAVVKRLWGGHSGALSRAAEERHVRIHGPSAGQHLPVPRTSVGTGAPVRAQIGLEGPANRQNGQAEELQSCVIPQRMANAVAYSALPW